MTEQFLKRILNNGSTMGFVTQIPKQPITILPGVVERYKKLDPYSDQARKLRRFFRKNGTSIKQLMEKGIYSKDRAERRNK